MKIESIRTNWRVLPSWKLTYFSLWEINIIFQPLPLNGICDHFWRVNTGRELPRALYNVLSISIWWKDFALWAFGLWKGLFPMPNFQKVIHEKRWGSGKNKRFPKIFVCEKSQLFPFGNWPHKETNKKCLPIVKFKMSISWLITQNLFFCAN